MADPGSPVAHLFKDVRAITFDAGWTLIYPHPPVGTIYADALMRQGISLDAEVIQERFKAIYQAISQLPRSGVCEAADEERWRNIVERTVSPECPPDRLEALFRDVWDRFGQGASWRLFDGVFETLSALRVHGFELYVLSNADRRFRKVFQDLGLEQFFTSMFISSEVGYEKPDLGIFRHVENEIGVPSHQILHVGDSAFHDGAAAECGWKVCILGRDIERLTDLINLLPALPQDMHCNDRT